MTITIGSDSPLGVLQAVTSAAQGNRPRIPLAVVKHSIVDPFRAITLPGERVGDVIRKFAEANSTRVRRVNNMRQSA